MKMILELQILESEKERNKMSVKAMIFVDGSWLYHSRQALFEALGEDSGFEIDYKRIPDIIAHAIADSLDAEVDMVRTNYFGTIPINKQGYRGTGICGRYLRFFQRRLRR